MMSDQRQAYMLLEILFYRYLKHIGAGLESYFAKTVMLWTAEEYPPSHPIWPTDGLFHVVHVLLLRLQVALYRQNLPMFFIREINLMEKLPKESSTKASHVITVLGNQLLLHVPFNLSSVVETAEAWHTRLDTVHQVVRAFIEV